MPVINRWSELRRRAGVLAGVCAMLCAGLLVAAASSPDQVAGDAVGLIDGEDIAVTGPMSVEVVAGQVKTILRSGSDVRVKSGQARISLVESGQISICGPAHFSVLKSGGTLTLALESGAIHARVEREPALTIFTAEVQGQTVAIGDEPRDILVGFETAGTMCIRTYRGAMRLENQLSGQSVMVPQGADVIVAAGQIDALRNGTGQCKCELQIAKAPDVPATGTGMPAAVAPTGNKGAVERSGEAPSTGEDSEKKEEPVYTVTMPPLRFDASAKVQPEPDPRLMMIVRRVRVRPTLIFQGRVEGEPVATAVVATPTPSVPTTAPPAAIRPTPPPAASVVDRVRSFFHKLWSKSD